MFLMRPEFGDTGSRTPGPVRGLRGLGLLGKNLREPPEEVRDRLFQSRTVEALGTRSGTAGVVN